MSDEIALRKDMERAAQADALLRNELLIEAFADLESAYISTWKSCPIKDTDGREKLWLAVKVIGQVKDHLQAVATSGALSARKLEEFAPKPKRFGIV